MGRHRISDDPEVCVGWEPRLRTFFLQVFQPTADDEDEVLLLDLGNNQGEIQDIAGLESALAANRELVSNAVLTPDLRRTLEEEKGNSSDPSSLQLHMIEMLTDRG